MKDTVIYFGDAVTALKNEDGSPSGRVGGYLVRFTDADHKDLDGEYFTAGTYYGPRDGDGSDLLFHHGIPLKSENPEVTALAKYVFKEPIKTSKDAIGIWAETVLNESDVYEARVLELVNAGKLKWSSGSTDRLVRREKDGKITRWPIIEGSLTHRPAYPLNNVSSIKALTSLVFDSEVAADIQMSAIPSSALSAKLQQHIEDLIDDGQTRENLVAKMAREAGIKDGVVEDIISGTNIHPSNANLKAFARVLSIDVSVLKAVVRKDYAQSVKGMFEEALADKSPSRWELETLYCSILSKLASAAATSKVAGVSFNLENKVAEATSEYTVRLNDSALKQITEYVEATQSEVDYRLEPFYFKAAISDQDGVKALDELDLDQHSEMVVSAVKGYRDRLIGNYISRMKIGRAMSERNRVRLAEMKTRLQAEVDELQKLIDETEPKATEQEKAAAKAKFLRVKYNTIKLGVTPDVQTTVN